jgi:hypothetical protein
MIYHIDKSGKQAPRLKDASSLDDQGWTEKHLETYLFKYLSKMISSDLMVIGQSSPYQPEVDLLAVDSQGDLWFFELKRGQSQSSNLLQVLRYSQSYSQLNLDDLSAIYEKFTGDKTRSLAVVFCEYFGYASPNAIEHWGAQIGKTHHLVVVTDGADADTIAAINHWQRHGLDIQVWPFRVYAQDKDTFALDLPELYAKGHRISASPSGVFLVNESDHGK